MDLDWQHEASMTRSTAAGEALVARGTLGQLVAAFLELAAEQQRGVAIRVAGADWTREYVDAEICELAARPEFEARSAGPNGEAMSLPRKVWRAEGGSLLERLFTGASPF